MTNSPLASPDSNSGSDGQERPSVAVSYEFTSGLPALLERLELSLLLTTYQVGNVVSIGTQKAQLQIRFSHFDQAMGLCRTPTGIAIGTKDAIWTLPANWEMASRAKTAKRLWEHKAIRGARILSWLAMPYASGQAVLNSPDLHPSPSRHKPSHGLF